MAFDDLAYSGTPHDRVPHRRTDPGWVTGQLARREVRVVPMWRDRCVVTGDEPVVPSGDTGRELVAAAGETVLLGLDGDIPVFTADLSAVDEAAALALCAPGSGAALRTLDLRALAPALPAARAGTLAYARGLTHWNRHTRFCSSCGSPTRSEQAGHVRVCGGPGCGRLLFPRIEPAVIMLIEGPGPEPRCLLARHHGAGADGFALLAGFVEIGESLEGTVRREAAEEAGVAVGAVTYRGSQGWPFPAGLMIGFFAQALDDRIAVDDAELVEARWFTRAEVIDRIQAGPGAGPADSIGGRLLRSWTGLDPAAGTH